MPHTYSQNYLHVVFSTKERRKLITKEFQPKLWSYMAGIARIMAFWCSPMAAWRIMRIC